MKKIMSSVLALLLVVGVVVRLSPFYYANAAADPVLTITIPYSNKVEATNITNTLSDVNQNIKDACDAWESKNTDFLIGKFQQGSASQDSVYTITIKMSEYIKLEQANKQIVMEEALTGIQNSKISSSNRNKIYNFIASSDETTSSLVRQLSNDVNADFAEAYSLFKPFSGVLGTFLGVISLLIFILLGITIVIDLAYINIPAIQLALTNPSKEEKPKLVSIEAVNAIKEAETKPEKNAMTSYLRMKTKQFIALGICLLYLVSGKLYVLIANIMDYFQGVLPD